MVAYTDPDCIPYFEGGDSVCLNTGTACDPSTVWCDQAEIIEAKLDFFDSVVARTATSVPIAWVQTTTPFTYQIDSSPPELHMVFTTVRVDTDNMVNLDVEADGFTINTPGLYNFWIFATGTTSTNLGAGQSMEGRVNLSLEGLPAIYGLATISEMTASWESFVNDVRIATNGSFVLAATAGTIVRASISGSGIVADSVTYTQVSMGASWIGDLP